MLYKHAFCLAALLCLAVTISHAQSADSLGGKLTNFSSRFFGKIQSQSASLNQQLTQQTQKYLVSIARREQRLQQKLSTVDSGGAQRLFAGSQQQYAALVQKLRQDTGQRNQSISGAYEAHIDTLQGALAFLQQHPQLMATGGVQPVSPQVQAKLQGAASQFQALQAKLQDADVIKAYVQQRQQQISQYLSQHANLQNLVGGQYAGLSRDIYYYHQQVQQYKDMLNHPDQLIQKALSLLSTLPAFQSFMRNNSQLGGLFHLPGNYSTAQALNGLQTKDQVAQIVQGKIAAAGQGGAGALQSNLQSAESKLDGFKDKLSSLGAGNGDLDVPAFTPNPMKTKTLFQRLQYGFNFQTTHNSYYFPTTLDLGLSLAYRLGHSNNIGIGASYKLGAGNGINDIALTSNGVGLRSFLNVKVKGSFFATAGLEYNYLTPFASFQQLKPIQYWTRSGLVGVTKTVSTKSKVFKQTTLSLLWDCLSYSQHPPTQAFLFRVGYNFN
jgi:hypothetical protein